MILARFIPSDPEAFISRCNTHVLLGRYAKNPAGYLNYLIACTEKVDPRLLEYLRVLARERGRPRYYGEADHIVPKSVWPRLMPTALIGGGKLDAYSGVLANLFWRDPDFNRKDDQPLIDAIKMEAERHRHRDKEWQAWANKWIQCFLVTKREEGVLFAGVPVSPFDIDRKLYLTDSDSAWLPVESND